MRPVPEKVNVTTTNVARHLEARKQPDAEPLSGCLSLLQPIEGVMISQGDDVQTARGSFHHEAGRGIRPIRDRGMGVEINSHCLASWPTEDRRSLTITTQWARSGVVVIASTIRPPSTRTFAVPISRARRVASDIT